MARRYIFWSKAHNTGFYIDTISQDKSGTKMSWKQNCNKSGAPTNDKKYLYWRECMSSVKDCGWGKPPELLMSTCPRSQLSFCLCVFLNFCPFVGFCSLLFFTLCLNCSCPLQDDIWLYLDITIQSTGRLKKSCPWLVWKSQGNLFQIFVSKPKNHSHLPSSSSCAASTNHTWPLHQTCFG